MAWFVQLNNYFKSIQIGLNEIIEEYTNINLEQSIILG